MNNATISIVCKRTYVERCLGCRLCVSNGVKQLGWLVREIAGRDFRSALSATRVRIILLHRFLHVTHILHVLLFGYRRKGMHASLWQKFSKNEFFISIHIVMPILFNLSINRSQHV